MTFGRWALVALAGAAVALSSGCSWIAEPAAQADPSAPAPPVRLLTIEQLAAAVGCDAKITLEGADFRQATCAPGGQQIVLVDFDTATGQREWLDFSQYQGGSYLVGDRWALSGNSPEQMIKLRKRIGGTVEVAEHGGELIDPGSAPHGH